MKEKLQGLKALLLNPSPESLAKSMADVHHPYIFSLVVGGTDNGCLTRVFIADDEIKPYAVKLHTHRYNLEITALNGPIRHHTATLLSLYEERPEHSVQMERYQYKSPLNGGSGLTHTGQSILKLRDYFMPEGATADMWFDDIHTMSCGIGAMWMVEEGGFRSDFSEVYGVPFTLEGLYNKPTESKIAEMAQRVLEQVNTLLGA